MLIDDCEDIHHLVGDVVDIRTEQRTDYDLEGDATHVTIEPYDFIGTFAYPLCCKMGSQLINRGIERIDSATGKHRLHQATLARPVWPVVGHQAITQGTRDHAVIDRVLGVLGICLGEDLAYVIRMIDGKYREKSSESGCFFGKSGATPIGIPRRDVFLL